MTPYEKYIKYCPNFVIAESDFNNIVNKYAEPHRYFHTWNHVETIIDMILEDISEDNYSLCKDIIEVMYVAAVFHDVIYIPNSTTNEEDSVKYFNSLVFKHQDYTQETIADFKNKFNLITNIILSTKEHKPNIDYHSVCDTEEGRNNYFIIQDFCKMDMKSYEHMNVYDYELAIFKEYQKFSIEDYRKGRIEFLTKVAIKNNNIHHSSITYQDPENHCPRIKFAKEFKPNIGIFAGTFNPFTTGHLNVLEKMEKVFDKVIIVCAINPEKNNNNEEIVKQVKSVLPFHEVVGWNYLITDYVKKVQSMGAKVTICKGLRNDHDMPYEMNLYQFTKDFMPDVSVCYFLCDIELSHISSSAIKNINKFNSDISKYLPTKYNYAK